MASQPHPTSFQGCAELALYIVIALMMAMIPILMLWGPGLPNSFWPAGAPTWQQVGPGPGPGGGPGGGVTATPRPSPTATPLATPRVTLVPTASPTPTPTPAGGGGGGPIPPISSRTLSGGQVHATVSGFFAVDANVALNPDRSSAGEFETWLYYGTTELATVRVGIFLGEPQYVQIGRDLFTAQSQGEECTMQVNVTGSLISGHISCTGVSAYDLGGTTSGTVTIELDFTADS